MKVAGGRYGCALGSPQASRSPLLSHIHDLSGRILVGERPWNVRNILQTVTKREKQYRNKRKEETTRRNVTAEGPSRPFPRYRSAGLRKCTLCKGPRREIRATRCENETAEPRSVFWTIGQRRRKESTRNLERNGREREGDTGREREKPRRPREEKKSKRARVFRSLNVTRTALPRSSDSRSRCTAKRRIMQRASSLTQSCARSV